MTWVRANMGRPELLGAFEGGGDRDTFYILDGLYFEGKGGTNGGGGEGGGSSAPPHGQAARC